MIERLVCRNILPARTDRHDQFHFVMVVVGLRRIGHVAATRHQRIRRLAEEERRLTRIAAHLGDMVGIVLADAIDAAHGKHGIAADDRQDNLRGGRKYEVHAIS